MLHGHHHPDLSLTISSLTQHLHHCFKTQNLIATKSLHCHLLKTTLLFTSLHTKLILSYATCLPNTTIYQTLTNFFSIMDPTNPLPFNTIVSDFSRHGFPHLSLSTLCFMHTNGVPLDSYTLCSSLTASSLTKNVNFGKQIHTHMIKSGSLFSGVYVGSALINLYVKSLVIDDASKVFDEIPLKNTVCANALLSGFADAKMLDEGLRFVQKMPRLGLGYDRHTFSAVLRVCASLSAVELGRQVHANSLRRIVHMEDDVFLQSSLIEMYGKCGLVEKAEYVFDMVGIRKAEEMKRDVVLWTSMLGVYGRNGRFEDVIRLYKEMSMERTRPDGVVFITVISACGNTGNVSLGLECFESMFRDFGQEPDSRHYSCVIDLLCKAGELEKAWKLVNKMPFKIESNGTTSSVSMWGALLSACIDNENVKIGKLVAERALELDPQNSGIYMLLSNLYAKVGMWDEIRELRELMKERGLKKDGGYSWIEVAK